jgi:hypothetical protein
MSFLHSQLRRESNAPFSRNFHQIALILVGFSASRVTIPALWVLLISLAYGGGV